jgi:hypothetical protein
MTPRTTRASSKVTQRKVSKRKFLCECFFYVLPPLICVIFERVLLTCAESLIFLGPTSLTVDLGQQARGERLAATLRSKKCVASAS